MPALVQKAIKVALVGNPNVGKSVIFNHLTGIYADVSNYPGTTIEIANAPIKLNQDDKFQHESQNYIFNLVDTPGVYGVSSFNDEEIATRDYILDADIIINVVSAISLSRDLFLTKQLADIGKPMIMVLNLIDEAEFRKVEINIDELSNVLGIKIIPAIAVTGFGMASLKQEIINAPELKDQSSIHPGKMSPEINALIEPFLDYTLSRGEAMLIAEADKNIAEKNNFQLPENALELREKIYKIRRKEVDELCRACVSKSGFSKRVFLGKILLNPLWGSVCAALILYLFLYKFLGNFVAGTVVDFFETNFFNNIYEPFVRNIVSKFFPIYHDNLANLLVSDPKAALGTFLAGDYGVLTLTVTYLYGLLLPLVLGFYLGLAILEDSGYLPRLAVLADGLLTKLGMNGRAIIPLILGGGCVTMAVVTTRLLNNKKEKLIAMSLLGLAIPCSAQLGVIQGLLTNIEGIRPWLIWGLTLVVIFGVVGLALNKLVPGDCGHFISDIPPLRFPRLKNLFKKTFVRTKVFMDEATGAFFVAAGVVAFFQVAGFLDKIIIFFEPLITQVLLLPKEVGLSFILGMIRRDFGAFGLLEIPLTPSQIVTSCLVLTLFVPCIATLAVMIKERNLKSAVSIWLASWILAFGFGAVFARFVGFFLG